MMVTAPSARSACLPWARTKEGWEQYFLGLTNPHHLFILVISTADVSYGRKLSDKGLHSPIMRRSNFANESASQKPSH